LGAAKLGSAFGISFLSLSVFPDAVQRAAVHRRSGIVPDSALATIPGLQRTTALRAVLRRARETHIQLTACAFTLP